MANALKKRKGISEVKAKEREVEVVVCMGRKFISGYGAALAHKWV